MPSGSPPAVSFPDVTLVLDVPVEVGGPGNGPRAKSRTGSSAKMTRFTGACSDAYRRAAGPGVVHIDATQSKNPCRTAAWREVMAVTALSTRGVS